MPSSTDLLNIELLLEEYLEQIRESTKDRKIEVDTRELTAAINRLPLMPSPEQIAQAVAKVVSIPPQVDFTPTLKEVLEAILSLKQTMREVAGRNLGGGGPSVVGLNPETLTALETVTITSNDLVDIKRGVTDVETRLDYDTRLDDQPVYIGRAPTGTATSSAVWTIEIVAYDANSRPSRKRAVVGAWDSRTTL